MKKLFFCAICALAVMAIVGCKGRTYKSQVMLNDQPTNFYHWSWTAQDAPWGICDKDGNSIIPRVYPKSVKYYGDYFIADSLTKQVLFSPTGQRLYEAEQIEPSEYRCFLIATRNGSQCVFDWRDKSLTGPFNQVKLFASGNNVFVIDKLEDGTMNICQDCAVLVRDCDEVIAVTKQVKGKKNVSFLVRKGNTWEEDAATGRIRKLTAAQVDKMTAGDDAKKF